MRIQITYETTSAYGFPVRHVTYMDSLESAESTCQLIEEHGYKIVDVTRID